MDVAEALLDEPKRCAETYVDYQDPDDRVFIPAMDYSSITPDPTIGAVLCGFDAYISAYLHPLYPMGPICFITGQDLSGGTGHIGGMLIARL